MPDDYLTLAEAANSLPGRPHVSTLWRWVNRGVRGRKLQTVLRGGRRFTRPVWLEEFLEPSDTSESAGCSKRRSDAKHAATERELAALGI